MRKRGVRRLRHMRALEDSVREKCVITAEDIIFERARTGREFWVKKNDTLGCRFCGSVTA